MTHKYEISMQYEHTQATKTQFGSPTKFDTKFGKSSNIIRQSAYFIAVISIEHFLRQGARHLAYGVYYIPKEYNGSPHNETCSLLGIPMIHVDQFFSETSELVEKLRECPEFEAISGIGSLTCAHTCDTLHRFKDTFTECEDDRLLLLNIEPKGTGKFHTKYPVPRITIPGGTMEEEDKNDFAVCGRREFVEETGIILDKYEVISTRKVIKDFKKSHTKRKFGFHFFSKISFDSDLASTPTTSKHESASESEEETTSEVPTWKRGADPKRDEYRKELQARESRMHPPKRSKQKLKTISMYFFIRIG